MVSVLLNLPIELDYRLHDDGNSVLLHFHLQTKNNKRNNKIRWSIETHNIGHLRWFWANDSLSKEEKEEEEEEQEKEEQENEEEEGKTIWEDEWTPFW